MTPVDWRPLRPEPPGVLFAFVAGKHCSVRSAGMFGWACYAAGEYLGTRPTLSEAKALAESAARRREP